MINTDRRKILRLNITIIIFMDIFYPIKIFADWITCAVFGLVPKTIFGEAINFFIYDTIKIFILLSVIILIVSIIRSFLPPEKIRDILSRKIRNV